MFSAIVAVCADNNGIGKNGKLPFHVPEDMLNFKNLTTNNTVIMGRKTFDSLPSKYRPLPDRQNLVLSNNVRDELHMTLDECLNKIDRDKKVFVIGGAEIYKLLWDSIDTVYLTKVWINDTECDAFFIDMNKERQFEMVQESDLFYSSKDRIPYQFLIYKRKNIYKN